MKNIKVLNVVNVYFTLHFFLGNQLSYFTRKGYEIHLGCSPHPRLEEFAQLHGCKSVAIEISKQFTIRKDLIALYKLWKYIRLHRFDVVCGHTPKGGLLSMIASFLAGTKKRIYFRHGLVYETAGGLKNVVLKTAERVASLLATKVVCVSPYLVERSISDKLTPKRKMLLLGYGSCNGIDAIGQFNPANLNMADVKTLRDKLGLKDSDFVIGFVGRMVPDKGVYEILKAFEIICTVNDRCKLLLIGPLGERDKLPDDELDDIKSNPKILWLGLIEEQMEYYYALMDIFVLPTHREGLGVSILEAQAMGVPALTTSHTGSRDAIVDGQTGFYVKIDAKDIADKVGLYLHDTKLKEMHGRNAREFILNVFKQKIVWDDIENKLYLHS